MNSQLAEFTQSPKSDVTTDASSKESVSLVFGPTINQGQSFPSIILWPLVALGPLSDITYDWVIHTNYVASDCSWGQILAS